MPVRTLEQRDKLLLTKSWFLCTRADKDLNCLSSIIKQNKLHQHSVHYTTQRHKIQCITVQFSATLVLGSTNKRTLGMTTRRIYSVPIPNTKTQTIYKRFYPKYDLIGLCRSVDLKYDLKPKKLLLTIEKIFISLPQ